MADILPIAGIIERNSIWRQLIEAMSYFWTAFCSYFGMCYLKLNSGNISVRILLFTMFGLGNIIFMSYRASLTSELSTRQKKPAFEYIEDLLDLDFQ